MASKRSAASGAEQVEKLPADELDAAGETRRRLRNGNGVQRKGSRPTVDGRFDQGIGRFREGAHRFASHGPSVRKHLAGEDRVDEIVTSGPCFRRVGHDHAGRAQSGAVTGAFELRDERRLEPDGCEERFQLR